MQCCTSARKTKARPADPASQPAPPPAQPEMAEPQREIVQPVFSMSTSNNVLVQSPHRYEESESGVDIEAAFLVVSNSLATSISSKERLLRALYVSGRHPSKKQINLLWREFADEKIGIDFKAFAQICKEEKLPTIDDFLQVFELLDRNRTGYVDLRELETLLTTRGEKMTREEFKKLTNFLNISSDGRVKYDDFCENAVITTHDCREVTRRRRVHRQRDLISVVEMRNPVPVTAIPPSKSQFVSSASQRSTSKEREISEQELAVQQQLNKRYPDSLFCKLLDPAHAVRSKIPKIDTWNEQSFKGYFILDDPSKGGFVTSTYSLVVRRESKIYTSIDVAKSQRLSERLQKIDIGFYIVNEPADGKMGQIHGSEFGFGEVHGVCDLPPGKYLLLPYTTGCLLKDYEAASKNKNDPKSRPKSASGPLPKLALANGKLSKELMDCIEDVFRLFDLDGDGFLSRSEFASYYRNSEDEDALDDLAWAAVLDRSEADGQKLSFANFTKLFELELDDADEDGLEDIVIGLNNLGITRHLIMEEACGYNVQVFTDSSEADVKLFIGNELSSMTGPIREAIVSESIAEGIELPSRRLSDVGAAAYAFTDDRHVKVVMRYKGQPKTRIQLRIDASESVACLFATTSGSLRAKDGTSGGGIRNVVTATVASNSTVPLLFGVPTHPERMAEFVISSIEIIQP